MSSFPKRHIQPNDRLGVILHPGIYELTLNKHLKYQATHLQNGQRTCGSDDNKTEGKTRVAFYGCSFTYGMGVSDSETYPYILQQQFPNLIIENHAVPGYGQSQVILELEKEVHSNKKPDVLILNYLSFHNERNSMNSAYRQKIRTGYAITRKVDAEIARYKCSYPFGTVEDGSLKMDFVSIEEINSTLPFINYLASMNTLQNLLDKTVGQASDEEVTLAMISRIDALCKSNEIELVVSYMTDDAVTKRLVSHCKSLSIPTINIFVDLSQKGLTNAPYDQHPSAKAHQEYADKLSIYLK